MAGASGKIVLRIDHLSKEFPGVKALDDVSMEFREGEVHCLIGENGAGKSTLIKAIAGLVGGGGGGRPGMAQAGGKNADGIDAAIAKAAEVAAEQIK